MMGMERESRPPYPPQPERSIASEGAGMVEAGNIGFHDRPVRNNPDGSISTVRTMSFNTDRGEVLVPTIDDDGRLMSDRQAVDRYRRTGRHFGIFPNPDQATEYAESLHRAQERQYRRR